MGSKNYDFFQDVIDTIIPELEKENIAIVQIGTKDDAPLNGCAYMQGQTDYAQTAFIVANSLCHVGNDSYPVHLASALDRPIVALYSISTPEICGPCFNDKTKDRVFTLTPESLKSKKPSFNPSEQPKTVNTIKVEEIVNAIYKALQLNVKTNIETLYVGNKYVEKIVEFVPDTILPQDFVVNRPVHMRVDLLKQITEEIEYKIFSNIQMRKFFLFMSPERQIINTNALKQLRENILQTIYDVSNAAPDIKYIERLIHEAGIKPIILYTGNDTELLKSYKINLIDFNLNFINYKPEASNKFEWEKLKTSFDNGKKHFLISNRIFLTNQRLYLTHYHLQNDISSKTTKEELTYNTILSIIDKDIEYLKIQTE